jgi:hypothetical protein
VAPFTAAITEGLKCAAAAVGGADTGERKTVWGAKSPPKDVNNSQLMLHEQQQGTKGLLMWCT